MSATASATATDIANRCAGGKTHRIKLSDRYEAPFTLEVGAYKTPTCFKMGHPCTVGVEAHSGAIRLDLPALTAAQARELATALLACADDADEIERTGVDATSRRLRSVA